MLRQGSGVEHAPKAMHPAGTVLYSGVLCSVLITTTVVALELGSAKRTQGLCPSI